MIRASNRARQALSLASPAAPQRGRMTPRDITNQAHGAITLGHHRHWGLSSAIIIATGPAGNTSDLCARVRRARKPRGCLAWLSELVRGALQEDMDWSVVLAAGLALLGRGVPPRPIRKPEPCNASGGADPNSARGVRTRHVSPSVPQKRPAYYCTPALWDIGPYPYQTPAPFSLLDLGRTR